jgi:NAD(P)-dependent dehydrogenase (short-subunit alcohol dehydrogenase family)
MSGSPVAVVTGANRGIGLEVGRQLAQHGFEVVLGARDATKGDAAAARLVADGLDVRAHRLDVTDQATIDELVRSLDRVDALVNNAAIDYDTWQRGVDADLEVVRDAFDTNVLGAWRMSKAMIPLLRRSDHGRIVNVSSEGGSISEMGGGTPAYSVSKAALNALTRILADELRADHILVNAICPGWVATDMGGPGGRPVVDGAASVVWGVLLNDDAPTGGFYRDGQPLPW